MRPIIAQLDVRDNTRGTLLLFSAVEPGKIRFASVPDDQKQDNIQGGQAWQDNPQGELPAERQHSAKQENCQAKQLQAARRARKFFYYQSLHAILGDLREVHIKG